MEKKDNLSNSENINIESIGPSTDDLKNRFKAESIPLQTDYSDLIDIADIGRKATGQAFGQTPSQDPTLELDSNDLLIVKIDPDGGLKRSIKGLGIKLTDSDQTKTGLSLTSNGLKVDSGLGIILTEGHGVSIQLTDSNDQTNTGLFLTTDGLRVDPGKGIKLETGHGVSVGEGNGIQVNPDDIAVKPKTNGGISVDADGVSVKSSSGINVDTNGVSVKSYNGINVDSNGVSIKLTDSDQTKTGLSLTSSGLKVDDGLGITLQPDHGVSVGAGNGIQVNTDNVAVKAKTNGGISVDTDGVSVKSYNGINVDSNGVSIKLTDSDQTKTGLSLTSSGLKVDDGLGITLQPDHGVSVGEGYGIQVNTDNVAVKAKTNGGISVDADGVAVNCWAKGGIRVTDSYGIYLKLRNGDEHGSSGTSGLELSADGVNVKAGNGITVDSNGVSVNVNQIASALANLIIPPGTIMPFYSNNSLPSGWVLCDGNNNTPNINNREKKQDTNLGNLNIGDYLEENIPDIRYIMKK